MGTPDNDYVGGLDLGLTRDRTALAIVHRDRRLGRITLDDLLVWQGTRSDPVSIAAVERAVVDASRRFPGIRVFADPWQVHGSIERLKNGGVNIRAFDFTAASVQRLSATLYSQITSATLRVFADPELEREVLGLQVVQRAGGWRVDHQESGYSDRAIALALAAHNVRPEVPRTPTRIYDGLTGQPYRTVGDKVDGLVVDPFWEIDGMDLSNR